jgi:hypothetical protein
VNANQFARARERIEGRSGRSDKWRKRAFKQLLKEAGAELVSAGSRVLAYRMPNGTTVCHKRRFVTFEAATSVLRQIAAEPAPRMKPVRAYPCAVCRGWHLTSKAYREPAHIPGDTDTEQTQAHDARTGAASAATSG